MSGDYEYNVLFSVLKKFMLIFLNNVYVFFIFIVSDLIKGNK